jgi:hypothetical protein
MVVVLSGCAWKMPVVAPLYVLSFAKTPSGPQVIDLSVPAEHNPGW